MTDDGFRTEMYRQIYQRPDIVKALVEALEVAADVIRTIDDGDVDSETGWADEQLLAVWKQCQAALALAKARP